MQDITENKNRIDLPANFDEWKTLYEQDPAAFEAKRADAVQNIIQNARPAFQKRLAGIQFQIDCQRQLAKNPMDAYFKISKEMWDSVHALQDAIHGRDL